MLRITSPVIILLLTVCQTHADFLVEETETEIHIKSLDIDVSIRKEGYVTGTKAGSFLDKKTGFRDAGFGLDIVDWIMEPGTDEAYRDQLPDHMVYKYGNSYHGKQQKRSIEGPQICTKAKKLQPKVIEGKDFVAVTQQFKYTLAAPGHKPGSTWTQHLVFPKGKRYFISSDRTDAVNDSDAMFLRIDMPGHIKHKNGDTFSHIYLSYLNKTNGPAVFPGGVIASQHFKKDFAPDERFNYRRDRLKRRRTALPKRFIRAYKLRDPKTGREGPWLAGMTLEPSVVHEAWCHQRGYVCMIQEFGGKPIKAGQSFSAAFIVGYFDSINQMHRVYDRYDGHTGLTVSKDEWKLTR